MLKRQYDMPHAKKNEGYMAAIDAIWVISLRYGVHECARHAAGGTIVARGASPSSVKKNRTEPVRMHGRHKSAAEKACFLGDYNFLLSRSSMRRKPTVGRLLSMGRGVRLAECSWLGRNDV